MGVAIDMEAYKRLKEQPGDACFTAADVDGVEVAEREWLVEDWFTMHTFTLFSGDGGTWKSLLALQLAMAVASGTNWIGLPVQQGEVLYYSAEDDGDELRTRIKSIVEGGTLEYAQCRDLTLRSLADRDALLAVDGKENLLPSVLYDELNSQLAVMNSKLLVLGTLADIYPANENDRAKARQFISLLRRLAIRHKCAVVALSHPSVAGINSGTGTSGSTGWRNSSRSHVYLTRVFEADGDKQLERNTYRRQLKRMKANCSGIGDSLDMVCDKGRFVTNGEGDPAALLTEEEAKRVFLRAVDTFEKQNRAASPSLSTNYAPKLFVQDKLTAGFTKQQLHDAMAELLPDGTLVVTTLNGQTRGAKTLRRNAR